MTGVALLLGIIGDCKLDDQESMAQVFLFAITPRPMWGLAI
jgi:hypothetical protein